MKKISLIIFILLIGGLIYFYGFQYKAPLQVILSPHLDDGVFSLGGLMAKGQQELLVATFFAGRPTEIMYTLWNHLSGFSSSDDEAFGRTKENEDALAPFNAIIKNFDYPEAQYRKGDESEKIQNEIAKDIQSIIAEYKNRELFIYGPGIFGEKIMHPDHKIVHNAFVDVIKKNTQPDVHFFVYEDFPYILMAEMAGLNTDKFNDYLNRQTNMEFEEKIIKLKKTEFKQKMSSAYAYKSQLKAILSNGDDYKVLIPIFNKSRCKTLQPIFYACEVVHAISK